MDSEQKFKKGDRVKVKYGQLIWSRENLKFDEANLKSELEGVKWYDLHPEYTKDIATIEYSYNERYGSSMNGDKDTSYDNYCLKFDKYGSISWFNEKDIQLV